MTEKHTPIVIDTLEETDVYTATLEFSSVGTSKNLFPNIRFSHHFTEEPETVPHSYQAILKLAEKIGVTLVEAPEDASDFDSNTEEVVKAMNAAMEKGDDTIH